MQHITRELGRGRVTGNLPPMLTDAMLCEMLAQVMLQARYRWVLHGGVVHGGVVHGGVVHGGVFFALLNANSFVPRYRPLKARSPTPLHYPLAPLFESNPSGRAPFIESYPSGAASFVRE